MQIIAGVDEAGRGPLAGPVVAAAVILDASQPIDGLADSKQLTEQRREQLAIDIQQRAKAFAIAEANVGEIDRLNILQASLLAMQRAVAGLSISPDLALIDGKQIPQLMCAAKAIIKGDQTEPAISAASILAKVHRDALMQRLDKDFPDYGFARHKGYPTAQHIAAIKQHGVLTIHRKTFKPVRLYIEQS